MSLNSLLAGYAFVKLTMDDAELKKGLESAQKKIRRFTASIDAWSSRMATVAPALGAAFGGVVRSFAEFDDQMRMVRAFAGATGRELEKLTELAKQLGRETSFTAAQVASGMGELGKSGFRPEEIQSAIRPMMDLARATGTGLAQASTIAANAMRQFKMETREATSVADLLVTTANASAVDLVDIGESLKMAGTAAASVGEDFRDVVAAIGVLGNMGLKGTMAGSGLRSAYLRIGDDKVWDKIEGKYSIRVETRDAEGNLRKLADIMADLAKEMNQLPTADRLGLAKMLFEVEGTPTGLNFTSNIAAIEAFQKQLRNSEGAARKAADTMDSGIGGALRRLSSAAEGFNLAMGEALSVSFLPLVESLSEFCNLLRRATTEFSPFIGFAARAAALLVGIGAAAKSFSLVGHAVSGVLAPLKTAIFYLDGIVSGTARAAKAEAARAAEAATATANAEKLKELAKTRSDAVRIASEKHRHYVELRNAAAAAQAKAAAEAKKLAAAKARVAAETALNERARNLYAASGGSSAGFRQLPGLTQAQNALKAQEAAMAASAAAAQKAVAAAKAAKAATLESAGAAHVAAAAYTKEAAAQAFNHNASAAYGRALGALGTRKMLLAALTKKHAVTVMAASTAEIVAAKVAAGASAMRTAAYYTEAAAAKVAAGATLALRAALASLAAHPVLLTIIAITAALWGMNKAVSASNASARKAAEEANKAAESIARAREEGDRDRGRAPVEFERLKQLEELSRQGRLTAEQMREAEQLMRSLGRFGSSYWATLDRTAGKLRMVNDAQEQFNRNMARSAKMQLEAEISALEVEISALQAENEQLLGYWNHTNLASLTGRQDDAIRQIESNGERAAAIMKEIQARKIRLDDLNKGDRNAVTGKDPDETTRNRINDYNQKKIAAEKELADAEDRARKLEDEAAKSKMSNLEREIAEIRKLRDEYRKYMDLLMETERARFQRAAGAMRKNAGRETRAEKEAYARAEAEADAAKKRLDSLRSRLSAMNTQFDQREKSAREKDEKRRLESRGKYDDFLGNLDADTEEERRRGQEEKTYEDAMNRRDFNAARQYATTLFNTQADALRLARERYARMVEKMRSADSDAGTDISDREAGELDEMQREIKDAAAYAATLRDKITRAREAAEKASVSASTGVVGAWSAEVLSAAIGGGSAADRTASAAETSVKLARMSLEQQKKQNRKLDDIKDNTKSSAMVYDK